MAKGKTRENKEFVKQTGFFEGKVVAINPDKRELEKLLGIELENDIEYTSTEEVEGKTVNRTQIVFWIRNIGLGEEENGRLRSVHFFLKDQERENIVTAEQIADGSKVKKKQYINRLGATAWSDKPENLFSWFVTTEYRPAKVGEEELYSFVSAWLNKLDKKDPEASLISDFKKLIRGDVSELRADINGEYAGTVAPLVLIRRVDKDGEVKEYEQIYNKAFLPGFIMKQIRTKKIDNEFIKRASSTERKKRSTLQKFLLDINDATYGIKEYYTLGELEDYDPTKNPAVTGKVLTEEDTEY